MEDDCGGVMEFGGHWNALPPKQYTLPLHGTHDPPDDIWKPLAHWHAAWLVDLEAEMELEGHCPMKLPPSAPVQYEFEGHTAHVLVMGFPELRTAPPAIP